LASRVRNRALIAVALAPLIGCAHTSPDASAPAAARKPARIETGENQTDPVRKSCKTAGPQIPAGESVSGIVRATYLVGADGNVSDVKITGKGTAGALQAIRLFIAGCTYAPARRDGRPVAVRWRGELDFSGSR
jgi:hypothetical protein